MDDSSVRQRLQLALRAALKGRDMIAVSALRSALAAIDNASAVHAGPPPTAGTGSPHFAGTAAGLGAAEAERRFLSEAEIEQIVRTEVAERLAEALAYDRAGHPDQADRLRREADVLMAAIGRSQGSLCGNAVQSRTYREVSPPVSLAEALPHAPVRPPPPAYGALD
jgi:uncharacterized protein